MGWLSRLKRKVLKKKGKLRRGIGRLFKRAVTRGVTAVSTIYGGPVAGALANRVAKGVLK